VGDEVAAFREARRHIQERIEAACTSVGRDPSTVELVAVSKMVPVSRLRDAVAAGLATLGENRVQEAAEKATGIHGVDWHLVGHLQANKAARAVELFAVIQSVDSMALAARLDRLAGGAPRRLPVYLQVNVDADPAKAGFTVPELRASVRELLALPNLEVRGLMTVGLLTSDAEAARPTFVALRRLSESLRVAWPTLGAGLSMGMSDDFEVAVEEGATLVRLGRALFGARPIAA
jgi:pyridoxal phosphate enzyme (YggS family)